KLDEALMLQRFNFPGVQEPLNILFKLGLAHLNLAKRDKTKRADTAEIYFRKYLQELKRGTVGTQRFADDVKIAESLGDVYMEADNPSKAAEVFKEALALIDVAVDKEKCPTSRVQFKYLAALHGQKAWNNCIVAAGDLVRDKEY